jgi:hypothetical protein
LEYPLADANSTRATVHSHEKIDVAHEWLEKGTQGETPRILLVHVGKTGGSSMRLSLNVEMWQMREKVDCLMRKTQNNQTSILRTSNKAMVECSPKTDSRKNRRRRNLKTSLMARQLITILHLFHRDQYTPVQMDWILSNANTFLITTRLPVSRVVSTFYYRLDRNFNKEDSKRKHDANDTYVQFYLDCFRTFDDLAQAMLMLSSSPGRVAEGVVGESHQTTKQFSTHCQKLGERVLQGKQLYRGMQHFDKGFHHYMQYTMVKRPDIPVVVVRTEHLWEDATKLAHAMGDNETKFELHTNAGITTKRKVPSSNINLVGICCQIIHDLEAYQRIILSAVNLNTAEKEESLRGSLEECGIHNYNKNNVQDPFDWNGWHAHNCRR